MIYRVRVGVATCRPPREDAVVWCLVAAGSPGEAMLVACQLASCHPHVVMPVSSEVVEP